MGAIRGKEKSQRGLKEPGAGIYKKIKQAAEQRMLELKQKKKREKHKGR